MLDSVSADEAARALLIRRSDLYFWCLRGSTVILFVGVILEYCNPFNLLRKSNLNIGRSVRPSRRWSRSFVVSERLAIAMVVIGIGGEGISEHLAAQAESAVREFDSGVALAARDRADQLESKNLKLQRQLAWRYLTPEQASALCSALVAPSAPGVAMDDKIMVGVSTDDPEEKRYASQLLDAIKRCDLENRGTGQLSDVFAFSIPSPIFGAWIVTQREPITRSDRLVSGDLRIAIAESISTSLQKSGAPIEGLIADRPPVPFRTLVAIYVGPRKPPDPPQ